MSISHREEDDPKTYNQKYEDNGHPDDAVVVVSNPLSQPIPWHHVLYKRLKLFPWWLRYNVGIAEEAVLKDKIIHLGTSIGLQDKWIKSLLRQQYQSFLRRDLALITMVTTI